MLPVVQQALLLVRNMEELDSISYQIDFGFNSISANGSAPSPLPAGPTARRRKPAMKNAVALGDGSDYQYTLTDSGFTCGREVAITGITSPPNGADTGPTVEFTITNSYFRHLGIWVRCLDQNNNPLDVASIPNYTSSGVDTQYDWYLTWVDPRERILGVPLNSEPCDPLTVVLPANAQSLLIQCGGLGMLGNNNSYIASNATYPGPLILTSSDPTAPPAVGVPGAILTGVIDLGLPAFFLLWGVASSEMEGAKGIIKNLATSLVELVSKGIFAAAFDETGSQGMSLLPAWGKDVLTTILTEAPEQLAELLAWAAVISAADDLIECLPIFGQIFEAIAVLTTLAQITETVVEICMSDWVILDTLIVTQSVTVQVSKDPSDYQYPASATQIQIVLKPGSGLPITYEASLDSLYPGYPTVSTNPIQYMFTGVPIGCTIKSTLR